MERDEALYDDDEFGEGSGFCYRCNGEGFIVVCMDDLCRNSGHCMHGDGEVVCPDCKGESAW